MISQWQCATVQRAWKFKPDQTGGAAWIPDIQSLRTSTLYSHKDMTDTLFSVTYIFQQIPFQYILIYSESTDVHCPPTQFCSSAVLVVPSVVSHIIQTSAKARSYSRIRAASHKHLIVWSLRIRLGRVGIFNFG